MNSRRRIRWSPSTRGTPHKHQQFGAQGSAHSARASGSLLNEPGRWLTRAGERGAIKVGPRGHRPSLPSHSQVFLPLGEISPRIQRRIGTLPIRNPVSDRTNAGHWARERNRSRSTRPARECPKRIVSDTESVPAQPGIICAQHVVVHDPEQLARIGLPGDQGERLRRRVRPFHMW